MGERGKESNKQTNKKVVVLYSEKSENTIEGIYKNTKQGQRSTGPKISGITMSEYMLLGELCINSIYGFMTQINLPFCFY